jgi:pyruvate dehydrogenase E1 component beta subunit
MTDTTNPPTSSEIELTYRNAVSYAIAQEMRRDSSVLLLGEDVANAGGVFKLTTGLLDEFGDQRVFDTPISEQGFLGAAMGAAMTGFKPIVEIMFSDFLAVCWDIVANQIAKTRYMTGGQVQVPLVIRSANGGGVGFGAQHSQSVENWAMMIPGLKVVAPSTPADVVGLLAAAIRDPDPVMFFEHKGLFATSGMVPTGIHIDTLGTARIVRQGSDCTIIALAAMVPVALSAAEQLASAGISAEVIDLRSLVPLDTKTILDSVAKTARVFTVEENPRLCGWGAEVVSQIVENQFFALDAPPTRITTPHVPLSASKTLEAAQIPSPQVVFSLISRALNN